MRNCFRQVLIADLPTSQGEVRAKELGIYCIALLPPNYLVFYKPKLFLSGAHFAGTNVTSEQSVLEMLQTFKSVYGRSPNTVVNCAGHWQIIERFIV